MIRPDTVTSLSCHDPVTCGSGPWRPPAIHSHIVIFEARNITKPCLKAAQDPGKQDLFLEKVRDILSATLPERLSPGAPQNPVRIPDRLDLS